MYRKQLFTALFLCSFAICIPVTLLGQQRVSGQLPSTTPPSETNTKKSLSLIQILNDLAKRHHVIFNYETDLLLNKTATIDVNKISGPNVDRVLKKLLTPYRITFKRSKFIYILYQEGSAETIVQLVNQTLSSPINNTATRAAKPQTWQLTGTITTLTGEALPGVAVLLKNTTTGTTTTTNGQFTLSVPALPGTLLISSIGYVAETVYFTSERAVTVKLIEDTKLLNEVVVTGYSTENRRDVSGAVSTVKAAQLQVMPSSNVEQQLQGKAAGVTVITNGQPGTSSQVRIRGFGSFGGNQPLYVVDGVPTQTIQFINPADIETTTVLKDAASASTLR